MIKAAVIGAGSMGKNHVRVYAEMSAVDLVAVADQDEVAVGKAVQPYRTKAYTDYREMLDRERPDVVSIAVPTTLHFEVSCEAMARGIHVLVEKPLAFSQSEGESMIDCADEHGVKLMVGHIERFNPAITEIKRRLERRELGRIFQIHARRLSPFPVRVQDVGVVLDIGTHDIDVMRYLLGSEVVRIYAEIEQKAHATCEDLVSGLLRFSNGVIGVLDVNWLTPTKVRQLAVLGEAGMYVADYLTQDVYWFKNSRMVSALDMLGVFRDVWEGDMVKIYLEKKEPLRAELEAFVATVLNDQEVPISGHDGLRALALAEALVESGRNHIPVHLEGPLPVPTPPTDESDWAAETPACTNDSRAAISPGVKHGVTLLKHPSRAHLELTALGTLLRARLAVVARGMKSRNALSNRPNRSDPSCSRLPVHGLAS